MCYHSGSGVTNPWWWCGSCFWRAWTISYSVMNALLVMTCNKAPDVMTLWLSMGNADTFHVVFIYCGISNVKSVKSIRSSHLIPNNSSTHPAVLLVCGIKSCWITNSTAGNWSPTSSDSTGIVLPPGRWTLLWRISHVEVCHSMPQSIATSRQKLIQGVTDVSFKLL